jgi:hypothetical protein
MPAYEDLFDIEKRPGAGVAQWTKAVERQLQRVRDANYRHRLHHSPNEAEKQEQPDAEAELHAEVYFLSLAIRRVVVFSRAVAELVDDTRLNEALHEFEARSPQTKDLRDFYEHLEEYLLDSPSKHVKLPGRVSPVLRSRWDCDNVIVSFGPLRMDVTLTALAALVLGRTPEALWNEHLETARPDYPFLKPDDAVPRMLEAEFGVLSIIGGDDEGHQVRTGILREVRVRDATPEERTEWERRRGQDDS